MPALAGWRSAFTPRNSRSAMSACTGRCLNWRRKPLRPGPSARWRWSPALPARPSRRSAEAQTARGIGYHAGLLSLAAMKSASEDVIIAHCEAVAREIPLVGFYLQPAVGGVILGSQFLAAFCRNRQRHRHQDRTIQPLSHPRRAARGRQQRARSIASRSIPAMTIISCSISRCRSTCATTASPRGPTSRAASWGTGRYGPRLRSSSSRCARRRGTRTPCRPTCWRSMPASPIATAPSSTSPTISTAASPAATKSCGGRG